MARSQSGDERDLQQYAGKVGYDSGPVPLKNWVGIPEVQVARGNQKTRTSLDGPKTNKLIGSSIGRKGK